MLDATFGTHQLIHVPRFSGFYAAEAALLREIENRFPAQPSSRRPSSTMSDVDWQNAASAAAAPATSARSEPVVLLAEPVRCAVTCTQGNHEGSSIHQCLSHRYAAS